MMRPHCVRMAPWRTVEADSSGGDDSQESPKAGSFMQGAGGGRGNGAVDVDEVGSSDEEDEGVEVHMTSSSSLNVHDPVYVARLAATTELSLLVTRDKHWAAATLRCRTHPSEAAEALEIKVRAAYTARITPLHFACEQRPSVQAVRPRNHQGSGAADIARRLNHPNKREVLGLLENTMGRLLRRKKEEAESSDAPGDDNLEWV